MKREMMNWKLAGLAGLGLLLVSGCEKGAPVAGKPAAVVGVAAAPVEMNLAESVVADALFAQGGGAEERMERAHLISRLAFVDFLSDNEPVQRGNLRAAALAWLKWDSSAAELRVYVQRWLEPVATARISGNTMAYDSAGKVVLVVYGACPRLVDFSQADAAERERVIDELVQWVFR